MRKREIHIENFNTNSIKNIAYEPVVYHGQQAFYIRICVLNVRNCVGYCIFIKMEYDEHIKWYKSRRNYYVNIKRNPFEKILW